MGLRLQTDTAPLLSPGHDVLAGLTVVLSQARAGVPSVRLDRAVAEGGIGVVYAARSLGGPDDARPLAVKVLQQRHAGDVGIVRRFEREAAHALRMCHPNVVSALGAGRLADGRPFFVMDLLEGATLGALVRAEGPLPIGRGLRLAEQILAGLQALHDANLVHRDLSPDNVFVTRSGQAVILDLGFAQEPGVDTGDGVTRDSPGSLVGTLSFMAPEQATRCRAITERSDLFAVAVLLYYAFSGELPFRGQDDFDVLVSVLRAAPVPLRRARRDAPATLEWILGHALAKHPDARFASAREMRDAVGRVDVHPAGRPRARASRDVAHPRAQSMRDPAPQVLSA
jgi:eukaryotic-like serine/threonine-protein kinase